MSEIVDKIIHFIKEESKKYQSSQQLLSDSDTFFEERKKITRFVNQHFKKMKKDEIRALADEIFNRLNLKFEEESPEKILFMLFTDSLSELIPTPAPLIFFYNGEPLIKKHSIIVEFNLLPQLISKIEDLDPYKKHQIALQLFPEDELIIEGVSLKLAQLNFLILNLLDKVLHEEIFPLDRILIQKEGKLSVDSSMLMFALVSVFAGMYEAVTGEKQQFQGKYYTQELSKYFVKIKNYAKNQLKDREEMEYLLYASKLEEKSIENRVITVRDYQTQKNVFEESIRRNDVDLQEKIESVFYLLGIQNINPVLLVRYYSGDDIIYYLFETFRRAQDEGFQTERFINEMKTFLKKLFRYPYISKGMLNQKTLDRPVKLFYSEDAVFSAEYFYFTQQYERFLDMSEVIREKDEEMTLKILLAKYFTGKISKEELAGWLSLSKSKEGQFIYHLLTDNLQNIPHDNPYRYVADLYTVKASHQDIFSTVGEEGTYTLILRIMGFYPFDQTLKNLADLRFER